MTQVGGGGSVNGSPFILYLAFKNYLLVTIKYSGILSIYDMS